MEIYVKKYLFISVLSLFFLALKHDFIDALILPISQLQTQLWWCHILVHT